MSYFSARLDFPSPPLSAPGSSRMVIPVLNGPKTGPKKSNFLVQKVIFKITVFSKSAYDLAKIKNWRRKQSHKRDGIGVERIRTVPFSFDSIYDPVVYDQVKTRLSEAEAKG